MKTYILLVPIYLITVFIVGASITAGLFVFHVAVVPLLFKYSKSFQRNIVFLNFIRWPPFVNFEEPSNSGLEGGRNVSLEYYSKISQCNIKIGIWHILPKSCYENLKDTISSTDIDKEDFDRVLHNELINSKTPIIMYCHGNSGSRGSKHRIELYKFFQQMDFHTIAFDYRGYGDSTNIHPSEPGVVEDALIVYDWIHSSRDRNESAAPTVFVWGHSLGTGISSHLLGNLEELSTDILDKSQSLPQPKGLILEAPFNNLADEVAKHPLSKLVTWLPYYENTFVQPFRCCKDYTFTSDVHLKNITSLPILMLHAKDDGIVPFSVGVKLYASIKESRQNGGAFLKLHAYDKKYNLGHKCIYNAEDLEQVVGEFITNHI